MCNDPEREPVRFYVELGDSGQYWIYDRNNERRAPQGPFTFSDEALEHARQLNSMFRR